MDERRIGTISAALARDGFVVLPGLHPPSTVEDARRQVIENIGLLRNTRPNPASGHLAGFHRYPPLEPLHGLVSGNILVRDVLLDVMGSGSLRSIGLSDITVNRSQEWHVDLLRGRYRHHLDGDACWGPEGGGVYKALLYLQAGNSLKVRPGAHLHPVPLDSDEKSQPGEASEAVSVRVAAGDLVLMDIRLPHRGSTEKEMADPVHVHSPKILVSTVLGGQGKPLTRIMEIGNFERLRDWDARHEAQGSRPRLRPAA